MHTVVDVTSNDCVPGFSREHYKSDHSKYHMRFVRIFDTDNNSTLCKKVTAC